MHRQLFPVSREEWKTELTEVSGTLLPTGEHKFAAPSPGWLDTIIGASVATGALFVLFFHLGYPTVNAIIREASYILVSTEIWKHRPFPEFKWLISARQAVARASWEGRIWKRALCNL